MGKLLVEYGASVLTAVAGYLVVSVIHGSLARLGWEIPYGGDKGAILFPLLVGLPVGAMTGTVLFERLVYNVARWNVLGVLMGFIFSLPAFFVALFGMDALGGEVIVAAPFLIALACLVGYRLGLRVHGGQRSGSEGKSRPRDRNQ